MASEWFYTTNKQQMGPVSWNELRELADGGILKPHDLVWTEGMPEWVKAINQAGLFADGEAPAPIKKAAAYTEAKPPPARRSKRAEEEDDEDDEDELEEKRRARKKAQERTKMAVGVKIALILAGIGVVLLLLAGCTGLMFYLSFGGGGAAPRPPVAAPPGPLNLANTTWVGRETLEKFGRLEFRFSANGRVTMIDAAGQSQGTYQVLGNTVTIQFGGQVTYNGAINGRRMVGNARNIKGANWTFNVDQR